MNVYFNGVRTSKEVLTEALELIKNGWIQGSDAQMDIGVKVSAYDKDATKFCMTGAIRKAANPVHGDGDLALLSLQKALKKYLCLPFEPSIALWNDAFGRTKEEVIKIFELAMKEFS